MRPVIPLQNKENCMKKKVLRFIVIYILSGLAFFALTMPFHKILAVFTVSEVRPSAVLYPFLGISFGLPASLGILTANFISDAVNGYSWAVLLEGIVPQFLYSMVPYFMWKYFTKGESHIHRLDSVKRVMEFSLVCFVSALLGGIGVGTIVQVNFGADGLLAGFFVFLNNFDISIILGCPLMIISNQIISRRSGTERTVTPNEKIIIAAAAVEAIALIVMIPVAYANGATLGTYDIWNSIYYYALMIINCIFALTLIVMIIAENKRKKKA